MFTELTASQGYDAAKPWIARITGTDAKYGLAREFIPARLERRQATAKVTEPGLYETCSTDGRKGAKRSRFYLAIEHEGGLTHIQIRETTLHEILDSGRPVDDLALVPGAGTLEGKLSCRTPDGKLAWRFEIREAAKYLGPDFYALPDVEKERAEIAAKLYLLELQAGLKDDADSKVEAAAYARAREWLEKRNECFPAKEDA